jgi:Flp pilus assembly protein TadD
VLLDIMGRHEEAWKDLVKGLALSPYDRQVRFNAALHHLNFGDLGEAEAHARKAVALGPGFPKSHELLATILMRRGKLRDAERSFREALSLDPRASSAGLTLAKLLTRQDRAKDAIAVLDGLLAFDTNLGEGYFMRGVLRLRLGQRKPGEADIRRAASLGHRQAAAFLEKIGR